MISSLTQFGVDKLMTCSLYLQTISAMSEFQIRMVMIQKCIQLAHLSLQVGCHLLFTVLDFAVGHSDLAM